MKLLNRQEIVGFLKNIKKEKGEIILIFEMQKELEIPSDFEKKINKYIGKKIGIFLVDNSYFFRVIGDNENAKEKKCSGDYRTGKINKLNKGNENETNPTKEQRKKQTV